MFCKRGSLFAFVPYVGLSDINDLAYPIRKHIIKYLIKINWNIIPTYFLYLVQHNVSLQNNMMHLNNAEKLSLVYNYNF